MRGRKKKPSDQKKAAGTYRKDRNFADELTFESLDQKPEAPKFLKEYGKQEWDRIVPQLWSRGILSETDFSIITAYCLEMELYYRDRKLVDGGAEYTMDDKGRVIIHPAVKAGNQHLINALKIASEYGLTPSSRTRISVGKAKEEDPAKAKLMSLMKSA
jgi:P27 family predicted phage terminase small subunit